jgi:hypothetical protein
MTQGRPVPIKLTHYPLLVFGAAIWAFWLDPEVSVIDKPSPV